MINVLLADDYALVRDGICHLLEHASDIQVVAQAADGKEAVKEYMRTGADVILLDISMPVMDGLETCKVIKAQFPEAKILILTVHPEEQYAARLLGAGALGYITKRVTAAELHQAVRVVARGQIFLPESIKNTILNQVFSSKKGPLAELSDRETQVFGLLAQGKKLREIAEELTISAKTAENYRYRILNKLNLSRTVDLIAYAYRHNLM